MARKRGPGAGGTEERGRRTATAKGMTGKPLKKHGDKLGDKIPGKAVGGGKAGAKGGAR